MFSPIAIAPSILSADFMNLERDISLVSKGGADWIHVDVMDGHFVPNLTIGPGIVKGLKRITETPLDVHLMIDNPETQLPWYLDAGSDMVTVHVEAAPHLHRMIQMIKSAGARCGVALNPSTPVSLLEDVINDIDMVLIMSVNPGFGGQSFIPRAVDKVGQVVRLATSSNASPLIQVDGGINTSTARLVAAAGADVLVAGNAVFGADNPVAAMAAIRSSALGACRA